MKKKTRKKNWRAKNPKKSDCLQ